LIRSRIMRVAVAGAFVGGAALAFVPQSAGAAQTLMACAGTTGLANANPVLGSGNAKYTKVATVGTTGTCLVDAGIRTNNTGTDSTKPNPYDDQTNGQSVLTVQKQATVTDGSASCNRIDPGLLTTYPQSYPLQGKSVWKFNELDALAKNLQTQMFLRLGVDPLDADPTHITGKGIVIKGVGVGGDVSVKLAFGLTASPKNLNPLDCVANPAVGNAALAQLNITEVTGWTISLP